MGMSNKYMTGSGDRKEKDMDLGRLIFNLGVHIVRNCRYSDPYIVFMKREEKSVNFCFCSSQL